METNVAGFPWDGNNCHGIPGGGTKLSWDSRWNVVLFDFYGASAATKMVFKLLREVCCDFTDTNCIISS